MEGCGASSAEYHVHLLVSVYREFFVSLVARLFPPPVFDRLQYAKMEEEGLGERVMWVTSGRREGRHEGRHEEGGDKLL